MFSHFVRRVASVRAPLTRRSLATPAMPHQGRSVGFDKDHKLGTLLIGSVITAVVIFQAPPHEHDDLDCHGACFERINADFPSLGQ